MTMSFYQMSRGMKSSMSSHATFVTLSRALCSKGILALFGISKLTTASHSDPSVHSNQKREEMIERFKIPRNASMWTFESAEWMFLSPHFPKTWKETGQNAQRGCVSIFKKVHFQFACSRIHKVLKMDDYGWLCFTFLTIGLCCQRPKLAKEFILTLSIVETV